MAVTFVYRSHYHGPTEKHVVRFEQDTVLDWFVDHWVALAADDHDSAFAHATLVLEASVYGFASLGRAIQEFNLAPPGSIDELRRILDEHLYVEGEVRVDPHCVQVLTDDDEVELAYTFFDDHYLALHGELAAYLLHEEPQLPSGVVPQVKDFVPAVEGRPLPGFVGTGTTWLCLLAGYGTETIGGNAPWVISNARLTDIPRWLASQVPEPGWSFRFELRLLRAHLLVSSPRFDEAEQGFLEALGRDPTDVPTWAVYSDWLQQHGHPEAQVVVLERALRACAAFDLLKLGSEDWSERFVGSLQHAHADAIATLDRQGPRRWQPSDALVWTSPHLCQAYYPIGSGSMFHQWVLFDDVWARAHPLLANGLLRWTSRWDVLTA